MLDDCYRIAWGSCFPYDLDHNDRPMRVDHCRYFLQLFHWGYHKFVSRVSEGMACCMRVLHGTIGLVIPDPSNIFSEFRGRDHIFEFWQTLNVDFNPGTTQYKKYIATSMRTIILKAADTMSVSFYLPRPDELKTQTAYSHPGCFLNYTLLQMPFLQQITSTRFVHYT